MSGINKLRDMMNKKLGKPKDDEHEKIDVIIFLLITLCDSKEAQQDSDDEKHADWLRQKTQSTYLNVFGISIACFALYISIFGIDDSVIMWLRSLL